mgnify:CR=1 FL=1
MLSRRFICATKKYSMGERGAEHIVGAPMFRRAFCYTAGQTAELTICGLGFYELDNQFVKKLREVKHYIRAVV